MGYVYLGSLCVALWVSLRRSRWPVRLMLSTALGMALIVATSRKVDAAWISGTWMPFEAAALTLTGICLTAALLRETRHRDQWIRFLFRVGVGCIPVGIAGAIWLFDPHNTLVTIFYAGRARFWQGMMLAWIIAWCNTEWGKRMSADGILCVELSILHGIAASFAPSDLGQLLFRSAASLVLLVWSVRYPMPAEVPKSLSSAPPARDWSGRSLPDHG